MTKHYIRLNENKEIIKAFSTDFEQPEKNDICVNENGGRHFNLDIIDMKTMLFKLKYINGKIVEKTRDELDNDTRYLQQKIKNELAQTDREISRPLEDFIDFQLSTIGKKIKDLPEPLKTKINNKKNLRKKLK